MSYINGLTSLRKRVIPRTRAHLGLSFAFGGMHLLMPSQTDAHASAQQPHHQIKGTEQWIVSVQTSYAREAGWE